MARPPRALVASSSSGVVERQTLRDLVRAVAVRPLGDGRAPEVGRHAAGRIGLDARVGQRPVERREAGLVELLVDAVAGVDPLDGRLVAVAGRVEGGPPSASVR